ncbi:MAG: hypothetical protein PVF68_01555 [Acidobacteriota bacterium]
MRLRKPMLLAAALALAALPSALAQSEYHPATESQAINCRAMDEALVSIPQGDGDGAIAAEEMGPGGWRFNARGQSFLTYRYELDATGTTYKGVMGQSNFYSNRGRVNDYPANLDVWAFPSDTLLVFKKRKGEIVLHGDRSADPPRFALPGTDGGTVRIPMHDPDGDGVFVGCSSSPWLKNYGLLVSEGGDFLQQNRYKAFAVTDENGVVTAFEWTEVAMFKQVKN